MLNLLKRGLQRTRAYLNNSIDKLFNHDVAIAKDLIADLEVLLLQADLGIATTTKVIAALQLKLSLNTAPDRALVYNALHQILVEILKPCEIPLSLEFKSPNPKVILLVGVNGVGKTTTIAKLANIYKNLDKKVVLACGDTFRAAAAEQLHLWGEKLNIPTVHHTSLDPAAVIYDAYNFTRKNNYDLLIADTAGRIHTKKNLMEELQKITRVLKKIDPSAPHEIMLILDSSVGQNSLSQAENFSAAIGISGITLSKLDGTAKAGIIFPIAHKLNIPIRYICYGEKISDIKAFNATEFVDALFT